LKDKIKHILYDLENQGWSVAENFFSESLIAGLRDRLYDFKAKGILKNAGIGRENSLHIQHSIRSDKISWFDEANLNNAQQEYLGIMQLLQDAINRHFYLGISEFEVHFALYPPATFYKRHLDQHKDQDTRVITSITYLNENWQKKNGGELQLYLNNGDFISVEPVAGTLVSFMSAEFEHEVLAAKIERASLTGWFRKRN